MMVLEWRPGTSLAQLEQDAILASLHFHSGNRTYTARALGISIRTLRNKINLYKAKGLHVPDSQWKPKSLSLEEAILKDLEEEMEIKKPVINPAPVVETDGPFTVRFIKHEDAPERLALTVGKTYTVHRVTGHKRPRYHLFNDSGKEASYRDYNFEYVSGNILKPARYGNYVSTGIDQEDFKLNPGKPRDYATSQQLVKQSIDLDPVTAEDLKEAEQAEATPYCKKHFYTFPCKLCR